MKKSIACIVIIFVCIQAYSQQNQTFFEVESNLATIYKKISRFAPEQENVANNNKFIAILDSVLQIPESYFYSFPDLPIGNVMSPDKAFRILSWNMIYENGTYQNFGFLQTYNKESKKTSVYLLQDKSHEIKNKLQQVCSPELWMGAAYYQVCQNKYNKNIYYTLIGWNPHNTFTQKKIIETLYFDKNNKPVFGYPMLELKGKGYQRRIIFEYSSKQAMMLRYDKRINMIVFDHLSPSEPKYTDIYEFYGPDFSIDAYKFIQGKWRYQADIDIRNPRTQFKHYLPQRLINLFYKNKSRAKEQGL